MDNTQLNELIRYHEYQEKFWGNGSTAAKFHGEAAQFLRTIRGGGELQRTKAVEAIRTLLNLAEGNLQAVFDDTRDTIEMLGHLPDSPSIKSARDTERAWCDAIAAAKAVLETPEKREVT